MPKERHDAVPAVYLVIREEDKILMSLRKNTGYEDNNWQVPAGHVKKGELPKAAAIREAKEELGIKICTVNLLLLHTMYRTACDVTGDRVDLFFQVLAYDGKIRNMERGKCAKLAWVYRGLFPSNTTPHVRYAIECIERGVSYSELGVEFFRRHGRYLLNP